MKRLSIASALLFAVVAAACGDRGVENTQNSADSALAPTSEETTGGQAAVSAGGGSGVGSADTTGAQPTVGTRPIAETGRQPVAPSRPAARTADEGRAVAPPVLREVTVPAGTNLPLELMTALSSETTALEAPVQARLRSAVRVDDRIALPAGTVLSGNVTGVDRAGRVQGRSRIAFRFDEATVNGVRERIQTETLSFRGEATKGEDATKIGVGAGVGAAIGGLLGGGDGAAKGAAIGGAAGTGAVLATRGKDVELAAGRDITATLANDVTVTVR